MSNSPIANTCTEPDPSRDSSNVLLVERVADGGAPRSDGPVLRALAVPDKPAVLFDAGHGDGPSLVALDALPVDSNGSPAGLGTDSDVFEGPSYAVFEAAKTSTGQRLLLITPPDSPIRLNGISAPLIAPLSIGDQVSLDVSTVLHVTRIQRTAPVPVPEALVGQPCSLCLAEFGSDNRVVLCPACPTARHMDGEDVPADDRLECAALGACPACGTELPESDGYAYYPTEV